MCEYIGAIQKGCGPEKTMQLHPETLVEEGTGRQTRSIDGSGKKRTAAGGGEKSKIMGRDKVCADIVGVW